MTARANLPIRTLTALTAIGCLLIGCTPSLTPAPSSTQLSTPSPRQSSTQSSVPTRMPTRMPAPTSPPASAHRVTAAELGASWRPGCPVPPEALRRVDIDYDGFDGHTHRGELFVHQD